MSLVRRFARPLLASSFIISGVDRLRDPESSKHLAKVVNLAATSTPQLAVLRGQEKLVGQALAGSQVAAGALFALGKLPRLSSTVLLATGAINSYVEYRAAEAETKEQKTARRNAAVVNGSLLGAIAIAAVDTDGNPSLAWRASKLSDQVAKKSHQLASDVQDAASDAQKKVEDLFA
ncbi:MAG: DoxX family membrane protein [Rothia sp. (in: high G+C Gram-positive bacteria)]|uniref:DoxX family protein n=1 Tax=Rothia sp. (in: high G+C Gram-positive bacteria) TaxID=1885016 RepID=UPI002709D5AE|nr:DoxX family membrane protein [Rothia sp. (in: high G+C Gram-positive bacteria)]